MAQKVGIFHMEKVEFGDFLKEFVVYPGKKSEHVRVSFHPEGKPLTYVSDLGIEYTVRFEEPEAKNPEGKS